MLGVLEVGVHRRQVGVRGRLPGARRLQGFRHRDGLEDLALVVDLGHAGRARELLDASGLRHLDPDAAPPEADRHGVRLSGQERHRVPAEPARAPVAAGGEAPVGGVAEPRGDRDGPALQRVGHPRRRLERAAGRLQAKDVARLDREAARRLRGDLDPRPVDDLGHRIGGLVEPGLVGAPPVVEEAGRHHHQGEVSAPLPSHRGLAQAEAGPEGHRGRRDLGEEASAPERFFPERVEGLAGRDLLAGLAPRVAEVLGPRLGRERALLLLRPGDEEAPRLEEQVARGHGLHAGEPLLGALEHDVEPVLAAPADLGHGSHRRLDQAPDPFPRHVVAPGLEGREVGEDEMGVGRGLVQVARQADHERRPGERVGEARLGRERVDGIRVLDHENRDLPLGHRLGQRDEVRVTAGAREGRVRTEADGLPDVAEGVVEEAHRDRGVGGAGTGHRHPPAHDQARPALGQALRDPPEPRRRDGALSGRGLHVHLSRERDDRLRLLGRQRGVPALVHHDPEEGEGDRGLAPRRARHPLVGVRRRHGAPRLDVDHRRSGRSVAEGMRLPDAAGVADGGHPRLQVVSPQ